MDLRGALPPTLSYAVVVIAQSPDETLVAVGVVGRAFAGRGAMKARIIATEPWKLFRAGQPVWLSNEGGDSDRFTVQRASGHGHGHPISLYLDEVTSREQAEVLKGRKVLLARKDLPPLGKGEFFLFDAVGAVVRDLDGEVLGEVSDVLDHVTVVNAIVFGPGGKLIVPITDVDVLVSFDLARREMVVDRFAFDDGYLGR